jgi:WD40 repeat protein
MGSNINCLDLKENKKIHSFKGHYKTAITKIDDEYFANCSLSGTIRVWNFNSHSKIVLKDIPNIKYINKLNDGRLCFLDENNKLQILNWKEKKCDQIIEINEKNLSNQLLCVLSKNKIATRVKNEEDTDIMILDLNNEKNKKILKNGQVISALCYNGEYLISGDKENTIKFWDPDTFECVYEIDSQMYPNHLRIKDNYLYEVSYGENYDKLSIFIIEMKEKKDDKKNSTQNKNNNYYYNYYNYNNYNKGYGNNNNLKGNFNKGKKF